MIGNIRNIIYKKNQGVTSILVVIAVAVILTIIIGGIAALTVREIRQSSNTELSNRALQTAEAGVRAASQILNSNSAFEKTSCSTDANTPSELIRPVTDPSQEITCLIVQSKFAGSGYESFLDKDKATQVFLGVAGGATNYTTGAPEAPRYLKISWNDKNIDDVSQPAYSGSNLDLYPLYPITANYSYAASIELTIISWPTTAFNYDNIEVANIFVAPGRDDAGFTNSAGRTQLKTSCNETGAYSCATLNTGTNKGFDIFAALGKTANTTTKFAVIVKPRYANTHFKLEAYNSSNTAVDIYSTKAQIDVTAKVGNLYRRVKAEKVISPVAVENVFDSVLFSGNNINDGSNPGICKNIITKSVSGVYQEVVGNSGAIKCN